jgi:hypothetical protein
MAKRVNPGRDHDWNALQSQLQEIRRRSAARMTTPCYPTKLLISKRGIPRTAINNWNTRKEFEGEFALDADVSRDGHRLYSARDTLFLSGLNDFSAHGVPLPVAKRAAKMIVDGIINAPIMNMPGKVQVVVFRRGDDWWLVPMFRMNIPEDANLSPRDIKALVFSEGKQREEYIGSDLAGIPALRIIFDVKEFSERVLADLGLLSAQGSADELRRVAAAKGEVA